tara:strand:+ start:1077 stop:1394 length:318 start_codon:yes stop_codon:yes gene_type:complete
MQVDAQTGFDAIIKTGEQVFNRVKEQDMIGLEQKLSEYTEKIEKYFLKLDKHQLSPADIERLEKLMNAHKNMVTIITGKKEKLSISIKRLQAGKKMQNTYPQSAL